jgi:hypothetical protein
VDSATARRAHLIEVYANDLPTLSAVAVITSSSPNFADDRYETWISVETP